MFDHAVIILYLVATLAIGFLAGKKTKTFGDFAIGKRNISTFALLAAIMASIVDASETIDYAGEVINQGLIYCFAYLGAGFASLALSLFFAPGFDRFLGQAHSTGDVIREFFGSRAQIIIGVATLLETVLFCGTQILAISITIQYFFGISGDIAAVIVSIITLLYFFRGGARSVNATDIFQFAILMVALPIFCGIALSKIGGYSTIVSLIEKGGFNFTASQPTSHGKSLAMLILFSLPGQYPLVIQRMLMAKNTTQLRQVMLWDAFIGTTLRVVVITIGIAAFLLLPNSNHDSSFLELANHLLPTGAKGLAVVGLLAIMMSTIDSTIHLGAVALTQDILGPISRNGIKDDKKLKVAQYSSLLVIIGAIVASFSFDTIGNLFYLLMALGNCLIWPGVFLGLTGFSNSKNAFWIGAASGIGVLTLCLSLFDLDFLYLNLIATSVSLLSHVLCVVIFEKRRISIHRHENWLRFNIIKRRVLRRLHSIRVIKNRDYCGIFAVMSIFLSIYPFFIGNGTYDLASGTDIFPIFCMVNGFIAVMILFVDFWLNSLKRFYPLVWGLLILLTLPTQTYFMLIQTKFSFIWLIDCALIIFLVATLSTKSASVLFHTFGLVLAIAAAATINFSYVHMPDDFGYWTVLVHAIILTLCFALFRKRDVELCRFEVATIAHETQRVLNTFESVADFYDRRLPILVTSHAGGTQNQADQLADKDLDMLLQLPEQIRVLTERTRGLLEKCIDRITSYSSERILSKRCSIRDCIIKAVSDASLEEHVRNAVRTDLQSDIIVRGNEEQLVQVFINILENAGHATSSLNLPAIHINIIANTVFVTDNGCGINAANLPSIFDEFFSTKSSSGQGLAFCKSVMLEHGGSIQCKSKENRFTRFELRFAPAD